MRQPFGAVYRTLNVPWNQLIHVGDVRMGMQVEKENEIAESYAAQNLPEECRNLHDEKFVGTRFGSIVEIYEIWPCSRIHWCIS